MFLVFNSEVRMGRFREHAVEEKRKLRSYRQKRKREQSLGSPGDGVNKRSSYEYKQFLSVGLFIVRQYADSAREVTASSRDQAVSNAARRIFLRLNGTQGGCESLTRKSLRSNKNRNVQRITEQGIFLKEKPMNWGIEIPKMSSKRKHPFLQGGKRKERKTSKEDTRSSPNLSSVEWNARRLRKSYKEESSKQQEQKCSENYRAGYFPERETNELRNRDTENVFEKKASFPSRWQEERKKNKQRRYVVILI